MLLGELLKDQVDSLYRKTKDWKPTRDKGEVVFETKSGWVLEQDGPIYYLFDPNDRLVATGTDRHKIVNQYLGGQKDALPGERTFRTYEAWRKACKEINLNVQFEGDKDICQAKPGIGEWDGAEGVIYTKDADPSYKEKRLALEKELKDAQDKGDTAKAKEIQNQINEIIKTGDSKDELDGATLSLARRAKQAAIRNGFGNAQLKTDGFNISLVLGSNYFDKKGYDQLDKELESMGFDSNRHLEVSANAFGGIGFKTIDNKTKDEILWSDPAWKTTISKHGDDGKYTVVKKGTYIGEFNSFEEAFNQIKDVANKIPAKDSSICDHVMFNDSPNYYNMIVELSRQDNNIKGNKGLTKRQTQRFIEAHGMVFNEAEFDKSFEEFQKAPISKAAFYKGPGDAISNTNKEKLEKIFDDTPTDKNYTEWYSKFMKKARAAGIPDNEIEEYLNTTDSTNDDATDAFKIKIEHLKEWIKQYPDDPGNVARRNEIKELEERVKNGQ